MLIKRTRERLSDSKVGEDRNGEFGSGGGSVRLPGIARAYSRVARREREFLLSASGRGIVGCPLMNCIHVSMEDLPTSQSAVLICRL